MRLKLVTMAAVVALAIGGCSSQLAPEPPESPSPSAYPDIVAEALKVLGPVPTAAPLSAEQEDAARVAAVESAWQAVLRQFPDAQRPAVDFEHYADDDEFIDQQIACLRDLGITVDVGTTSDGQVGGYSMNPASGEEEAAMIGHWSCEVRYPQHPRPPATPEQLGYLYDYFTQFVVPCLEAHGQPQTVPLTRVEFIANWPNQNWFPSSNQGVPDGEATDAACPSTMPDMR